MNMAFTWPTDPAVLEQARLETDRLLDATRPGDVHRLMDVIDVAMAGETRAAVLLAVACKLGVIGAQCTEFRPHSVQTLAPIFAAVQLAWNQAVEAQAGRRPDPFMAAAPAALRH